MVVSFWQLFAVYCFGFATAALVLGGVGLGGYLVFVTKRDDTSALLSPFSRVQGDSYIAKDEEKIDDIPDDVNGTDATSTYNKIIEKMNKRFLGQTGLGGV